MSLFVDLVLPSVHSVILLDQLDAGPLSSDKSNSNDPKVSGENMKQKGETSRSFSRGFSRSFLSKNPPCEDAPFLSAVGDVKTNMPHSSHYLRSRYGNFPRDS